MKTNKKYDPIRDPIGWVMRECDCSRNYVNSIITGERVIKTRRAKKGRKVISKLDELARVMGIDTQTA